MHQSSKERNILRTVQQPALVDFREAQQWAGDEMRRRMPDKPERFRDR